MVLGRGGVEEERGQLGSTAIDDEEEEEEEEEEGEGGGDEGREVKPVLGRGHECSNYDYDYYEEREL